VPNIAIVFQRECPADWSTVLANGFCPVESRSLIPSSTQKARELALGRLSEIEDNLRESSRRHAPEGSECRALVRTPAF